MIPGLAVVAILTRVQIFGDPLASSDEGFYLLVGERVLQGALPYVDIWDRKPVGLFLLYAGMRALGGDGVLAYQFVGTLVAFATALLVARIAGRFSNRFGAFAAGTAYLLWLPLGSAAGGQAELFCNLPMAAAALLTLRGLEQRPATANSRDGTTAMLLVGIAMQIKYTALFAGIFLGCCWMYAAWRAGRRAALVPLAGWWMLAALAPTLLAAAWYAAQGHFEAFLYANFVSAWQRSKPPFPYQLRNLAVLLLILAPLFACIRPRAVAGGNGRTAFRFVAGWLAAATTGMVAFGTYFHQFLLPVAMPASAAAATRFGLAARRGALVLLGVALVAGQCNLFAKRVAHGSSREVQRIVDAVDPQGCLFIYSGLSAIYRLTNACIPTRYAFPSHLSRLRESGAIGTDPVREVERIMEGRPQTVIVRSPYVGENWAAREVALRHLAADYRLVLEQELGVHSVSVYRLERPDG